MLERERETWNESERLGEKKESVEREIGKKGERERETYERIQGMRKKRLRRIITSNLNF
jgi:uncharacterized protein YdcH (DUF465 family)